MYWGLRLLTLFAMVLKEVSFLDPSSMVLKEPLFMHVLRLDGLGGAGFGSVFGTFGGWS